MGRNTVESCMFCTPNPCTCFEKPKAKAKSKLPPSLPTPVVPLTSTAEPRRTALTETSAARAAMDEDRDLRRAVTILCKSGIVGSASVVEHAGLLDMTPVEAKLLIWKLRRVEWLYGQQKS